MAAPHPGPKRLVPKAALDPIATIVRQARYALDGLSHALPDGSRFVLTAVTPEVEAQLTRTRARFGHAVETFLAGYPRWRAEMAPQWDAAARTAWHTAGRPGDATPFVTAFLARVAAAYPMAGAPGDASTSSVDLPPGSRARARGLIGLADAERPAARPTPPTALEVSARRGGAGQSPPAQSPRRARPSRTPVGRPLRGLGRPPAANHPALPRP
jgi:hypothetical protein